MSNLEGRIKSLEVQVAELLESQSSREVGSNNNPAKAIHLANQNGGSGGVVEYDSATNALVLRKADS